MVFRPESIDSSLKALNQWDCYKLEIVDGKKTKIPYSPATGQRASSTDLRTWTSFNAASAAYQDMEIYDGICFFVTEESGIVFIDLDDCIKDGEIEPWALEIVKMFASYTERSQSGKGLHILIRGIKPGNRCRNAKYPHKVEIYSSSRQCCLTGDLVMASVTNTIEARQEQLDQLYTDIFGEDKKQKLQRKTAKEYCELPDDTLIQKALKAKNGQEFKALWEGGTSSYNGDESAADMALANMLAFWTGGNAKQMERLFSRSGLGKRAKWTDRQDYRVRTIQKAISEIREFYEPEADRKEKQIADGTAPGPTVIDAIRALNSVCDGAKSNDSAGFNKFDLNTNKKLIEKVVKYGTLSRSEEKKALNFLEKYKKQLKTLNVDYDQIDLIKREPIVYDQAEKQDGLPEIVVTAAWLYTLTVATLPALVAANEPPTMFARSGALVRIRPDENGIMQIEPLSESALRGMMARCARYMKINHDDEAVPTYPPSAVVKDILALPAWPAILPLIGLITSPVVRSDGSIVEQLGYDAATRLYYTGKTKMALNVPETPTQTDAKEAAAYIVKEVFGDFPFKDQASRANTVAALLTTLTLPLINGNIPLGLFDKPQAGTGASLLTEIIAEIATGAKACMQTAPDSDDEWRKAITAVLISGPQIVVIDNVTAMLKSAKLSQMLTARTWSDRMLGISKMLNLSQTAAWFATGNNIQLGGDIARRAYWIRLDAAIAQPWLRDGFRHPDLMKWVHEHRSEIMSMLLTMVRAWIVAGKPKGTAPRIGSFEEWSKTIGGILTYAGVDNFLGNAAELYDNADQETGQWDLFLEQWQKLHRDDKITAAQLKIELTDVQSIYKPFQNEMPEGIIKATDKGTRGASMLGQALHLRVDQVFPSGRKLIGTQDKHTKAMKWSVIVVGRSAEDQKAHGSQAIGHFAEDAEDGLTQSQNRNIVMRGVERVGKRKIGTQWAGG